MKKSTTLALTTSNKENNDFLVYARAAIAAQTGKRGRPLTINSLRMSEAIVRKRFIQGQTLQAIADFYNTKWRSKDERTITAQGVKQRIDMFAKHLPEYYKQILGQKKQQLMTTIELPNLPEIPDINTNLGGNEENEDLLVLTK
jgi:hypothetical protein